MEVEFFFFFFFFFLEIEKKKKSWTKKNEGKKTDQKKNEMPVFLCPTYLVHVAQDECQGHHADDLPAVAEFFRLWLKLGASRRGRRRVVVARLRRHDRNGSSWRDELGATTLPLAMAQIAQRRSTSCSGDGGDRKRRRLDRKTRAAPPLKRSSDRRRNCCCRCRRRRRRRHRKSRPLQRPRAELHCHFFYAGCVDDVERVPRGCVRSEMSGGIDAWEDGIGMLKKDSTLAF